ncbi:hypothetical protein BDV38DRAFT_283243 [Aspergillus pseudotamarii]|uniref:Uncharacterized protein n=1 Tax=Aspergillus pseudotamarii TaxID=132259 RepID=A0A5N6STH5_ASPPS|nr:uncharacterized protein BDV38DRAFT_283243 [Aspergillus pseudotamarii]KAE8137129.1 hypothetical protein BDV38DRAFT_283243 [Aspergillus pseudotamarii]
MTTVRLRSPDGNPIVFEMPENSTVADLVKRGFQELNIRPVEFVDAYIGDQPLPANDLLKAHQEADDTALAVYLALPNEVLYEYTRAVAALSNDNDSFTPGEERNTPAQTRLEQREYITSDSVDEVKVNWMFQLEEMVESLKFPDAESRELPQISILWLDAIARAQYNAYSERRSRTVIEAFLIPALAMANTGVNYSNHEPTCISSLKPQPLAEFSLVPEAKLVTSVEYTFNSKAKTIYHINGRVDWGIGAYDVTTRRIKLLVAIEAKSQVNWGEARGELLLYMATIQNERKVNSQRMAPVHGFCSDGDIYLFAILHENSKYQFTKPLPTASYEERCTVFSNMVYILQQAKAAAASICELPH